MGPPKYICFPWLGWKHDTCGDDRLTSLIGIKYLRDRFASFNFH